MLVGGSSSQAGEKNSVNIYLKIFHKRNKIIIRNDSGVLLNDYSRVIKKITVEIKNYNLFINGSLVDSAVIIPLLNNSYTSIETKYGIKKYNGFFNIRLVNGHFYIINTTDLNSYLEGVVGSEMGDSFRMEALKAQAIAARSYYLKRKVKNKDYDIWDIDGSAQVFRGLQISGPKTKNAVKETSNLILESPDPNFMPYYHSTCGGMLLTSSEYNYKKNIKLEIKNPRYDKDSNSEKDYCSKSPYYRWECVIDRKKLISILSNRENFDCNELSFSFDEYGFLRKVILIKENRKKIISGIKMKQHLEKSGISSFRSIRCRVENNKGKYEFIGKGFGHFIGMCQWGANGMAEKGFTYREILHFYYPNARIAEM